MYCLMIVRVLLYLVWTTCTNIDHFLFHSNNGFCCSNWHTALTSVIGNFQIKPKNDERFHWLSVVLNIMAPSIDQNYSRTQSPFRVASPVSKQSILFSKYIEYILILWPCFCVRSPCYVEVVFWNFFYIFLNRIRMKRILRILRFLLL